MTPDATKDKPAAATTRPPWSRQMIQERFLFVLVTLILFIILPPFLEGFTGLRLFIDIFFTAIFISVILAIGESERDTLLVLLLSGPLFVLVWMTHLVDLPAVTGLTNLYSILFLIYACIRILRFIIRERRVTRNVIYAAIVVYLIIGVIGAVAFELLEMLSPGSLSGVEGELGRSGYLYTYNSFVTLTTLGFGDVTPQTSVAGAMSILLAIIGQLYLTVLVAALVGKFISQPAIDRLAGRGTDGPENSS